jgi:hypothetical protein
LFPQIDKKVVSHQVSMHVVKITTCKLAKQQAEWKLPRLSRKSGIKPETISPQPPSKLEVWPANFSRPTRNSAIRIINGSERHRTQMSNVKEPV